MNNQVLRSTVSSIAISSRNAQGVRLMRIKEGDVLRNVARIAEEFVEKDEEETRETPEQPSDKEPSEETNE